MAVIVGYWQDNNDVMYREGPFVLVTMPDGWRVEKKGSSMPICLDDPRHREVAQKHNHPHNGTRFNTRQRFAAVKAVDELNKLFPNG